MVGESLGLVHHVCAGVAMKERGFFAVGMWHPKTEANVGTAWRSASSFGAAFMFTVGRRYRAQSSDTANAPSHIPLFHFDTIEDAVAHMPHGCPLVGVEMDDRAVSLPHFRHPPRAAYLLGAEDKGLTPDVLAQCRFLVQIPFARQCLNVAAAATVVIYDRARCMARGRALSSVSP